MTNAQLSTAIAGTSNTINGVTTLGSAASFAYDQMQMQEVINELINALRR